MHSGQKQSRFFITNVNTGPTVQVIMFSYKAISIKVGKWSLAALKYI